MTVSILEEQRLIWKDKGENECACRKFWDGNGTSGSGVTQLPRHFLRSGPCSGYSK